MAALPGHPVRPDRPVPATPERGVGSPAPLLAPARAGESWVGSLDHRHSVDVRSGGCPRRAPLEPGPEPGFSVGPGSSVLLNVGTRGPLILDAKRMLERAEPFVDRVAAAPAP